MPELALSEILAALGGTSAISIAISTYLSKLASDRLNIKWKAKADQDLEQFKADMAKNQALITNIYTQYTNGYHHGQERRLKGIEVLWNNLRTMVDFVDTLASSIYNILTKEEIENYWSRESNNAHYQSEKLRYSDLKIENLANGFFPYAAPVEQERPFLGEKIYQHYTYYKVFLGRLSYLIINGAEKRKFIHWHDDVAIVDILKSALTSTEFNYVISSELRSYELTKNIMEIKLIGAINEVISGHAATESALDLVKKYDAARQSMPIS